MLVGPENVHAEAFFLHYHRQELGALIDADEDEQWIQRNRGERIGGHAVDFAKGTLDGEHAYAGGELTAGDAKLGWGGRASRHEV